MRSRPEAAQYFEEAWTLDPGNAAKAYYVATQPGISKDARDKARMFLLSSLRRPVVPGLKRTDTPPPFVVAEAIPDSFGRSPIAM